MIVPADSGEESVRSDVSAKDRVIEVIRAHLATLREELQDVSSRELEMIADDQETESPVSMIVIGLLRDIEKKSAGERVASAETRLQIKEPLVEEGVGGRERAKTRKGAALDMHINDSLVKLADKLEIEGKILSAGYDVNQEILDFTVPLSTSLITTIKVIAEMLLVSLLFSLAAGAAVYCVTLVTKGIEVSDSADMQWGVANHTAIDYERDDFNDVFFFERDRSVKTFLVILSCTATWIGQTFVGLFFRVKKPLVLAMVMLTYYSVVVAIPVLPYTFGVEYIDSTVLIVIFCFAAGLGTALMTDTARKYHNLDTSWVAADAARTRFEGTNEDPAATPLSRAHRAKVAFIIALPVTFILVVIAIYSLGIFRIYNASDSSAAKAAVAVLGLLIKVTGNKGLLVILNLGDLPSWMQDITMFQYEYATALLCRIMQLSIPDPTAAMLMSLFGANLEMGVRVFFFTDFLKMGLRLQKRGRRATAVLVWLVPTGAFEFSSEPVGTDQVITITMFQIVPELFLDFFCTFVEVNGGLTKLHKSYWSTKTGAKKVRPSAT
ncbi:hypothetical protein TrCOL_g7078 [Triparma columacea]|uniref:Uncharacterized protein n=1 Tax=Triparma columacea TaxID=722753 RepID=A0A9W7GH17_9STRA|nr:hypothetical protein TrCOL_g7078 [Triparma columacea]